MAITSGKEVRVNFLIVLIFLGKEKKYEKETAISVQYVRKGQKTFITSTETRVTVMTKILLHFAKNATRRFT